MTNAPLTTRLSRRAASGAAVSLTNAAAKFQAAVKAARINAKLDEVIGLLKRQAVEDAAWGPREKAAWESRPVPSAPGVLNPYEMVQQFNNASAPQMAQKCAELKAAYIAGVAMICAADAAKIIEDADQGKNLKYARKANMNRTIAKLRDRFLLIILEENLLLRQALLDRLCCDIAAYPEPIRPGRSPARKSPRSKRFPIAKKSVLP